MSGDDPTEEPAPQCRATAGGGGVCPPTPKCLGKVATIIADEKNAVVGVLVGTEGDDVIVGFPDRPLAIRGSGGNDRICGGALEDHIFGGEGHDHVSGGGGPDSLDGEEGNDRILGGPGDDFLYGLSGSTPSSAVPAPTTSAVEWGTTCLGDETAMTT